MRKNDGHLINVFAAILIGLLICSCAKVQEPSIQDVRISRINATSLTSADIRVSFTITNPNKKPLSAESASGEIFLNGEVIAEFYLKDTPLTAPPVATTPLEARANIKITNPLYLLSAGFSVQNPDFSQLTASADILIKIGDMQHRIRFKKYPLEKLTSHLNI